MTFEEKRAVDIENLEVTELEDEDLEDISGGANSGCPGMEGPNNSCPGGIGMNNGCPELDG